MVDNAVPGALATAPPPGQGRAQLRSMGAETKKRHEEIKKTVGGLQDAIDALRLSIKYMMFDLEATRRDNDYLRKMLEQDPGDGRSS